jgi:transcriptional regulator with XRE-family HTH domain
MQENKSSILYKTEKLSKKAIGMRFKELRNEKGISQQSMAKILNVSRSNYSQIELGNQYPTFETLAIISDYCGRSYEWILHGEGNESFTPNITITEQTGNIEVSFPKVDIKDKRTVTVWASQIEEYIQKSADPSYIKGLPGFEIPRSVSEGQDTVFRAFSVGEDILTLGVKKNDMIIAKPLSNYSEVIFNHTFVIVTTSSIVICRILDFVSASKIFICNDGNPNMQQSLIALSEIKEIWMATGIYSASSGPVASKISEQLVKFQTVLNNLQDEILQLKKALNN